MQHGKPPLVDDVIRDAIVIRDGKRLIITSQGKPLSLLDPRYNLREIIKQMLLLEQHLCHPEKRCPDCICKHLMTIEALAEEGVQLDKTKKYVWLARIAAWSRMMQSAYLHTQGSLCDTMGIATRQARKSLWRTLLLLL